MAEALMVQVEVFCIMGPGDVAVKYQHVGGPCCLLLQG